MTSRSKAAARLTGLLIGCGLCVGFLLSGRLPDSSGELPARLTLVSAPTSELAVSPAGRFLSQRELIPGAPRAGARGTVSARNRTRAPLAVRLRALPSSGELDELLRIRITADGAGIFRGKLRRLRRWSARAFRLAARQGKRIELRAWLPSSVTDGYQARTVELRVEWKTRALGA
jgi:hypothetical protein